MAKKYSKKVSKKPKKDKKDKKVTKKQQKTKKKPLPKKSLIKKEEKHHKFEIKSGLEFSDILVKVVPIKGGKYGVIDEGGEFVIFSINNKKEIKPELKFQIPQANSFCQLGNGIFVFNSLEYITFWELVGTKLGQLAEYETIHSVVVYAIEPINENYCAISGPNDIIELVKFTKQGKLSVENLDFRKSKIKNKKNKKKSDHPSSGIGCLYFQKKHSRLLATHFNDILRVWNCDFAKNKYELFKEVEPISNYFGNIIHETKNKILIGGRDLIAILNNDTYEITDFINLGNKGYEIFSMEMIKYYNFKEFAVCGLRSGKILGVDIDNKRIEFTKIKQNNTGKDNEMEVKNGKISFYGENISYIKNVENQNLILVASHDHILKLYEY